MTNEAIKPVWPEGFYVTGPDSDGDSWLHYKSGKTGGGVNLGKTTLAKAALAAKGRPIWPTYQFGFYGPAHKWFAWFPVKTWDNRWVWGETINRRRVFKKTHIDGPDWQFWAYTT